MPNWCSNNLTINSDNPELIARFEKAIDSNGLFDSFLPLPEGASSYSWCVENWGTKWDVYGDGISVIQMDEDRIIIAFDTAWSPPLEFYKHLESLGYSVEGMYYEPGLAFCGTYSDGYDDYYEIGTLTSEEIKATIPDDLDMCFAISEFAEERERDDE